MDLSIKGGNLQDVVKQPSKKKKRKGGDVAGKREELPKLGRKEKLLRREQKEDSDLEEDNR